MTISRALLREIYVCTNGILWRKGIEIFVQQVYDRVNFPETKCRIYEIGYIEEQEKTNPEFFWTLCKQSQIIKPPLICTGRCNACKESIGQGREKSNHENIEGKEARKTKSIENILVRVLLMGKKKEFFDFVKIKGKIYKVSIQPYVSPEELFKRAVNSGAFTADELKEEA